MSLSLKISPAAQSFWSDHVPFYPGGISSFSPRVGRAQRPFHELVAADVRMLRAVRSESAVADTLSSVPRAAGGDRPRSQPSRTPCVRLSRRASRYGGVQAFK